jgi:hypothetical protein
MPPPQIINLSWHTEAKRKQQEYYNKYGDKIWWTGHPRNQTTLLQENIASVLYGPPNTIGENVEANGYTNKQQDKIKGIAKKICKYYENEVSIGLVFLCAYIKNTVETKTLFRVWDNQKSLHIDTSTRVYQGWQPYLKENNLPRCEFCAPFNGRYMLDTEGNVRLEFRKSPSSQWKNRLFVMLDILFLVLAILGLLTGIIIKSLDYNPYEHHFSYVSIALVSLAAFYNILRFIFAFYDMIKHS